MNSFRSSALKALAVLACATLAGCGSPEKDLAAAAAACDVRDFKKAVSLFARVLDRQPDNVDALVGLAQANLGFGEIAAAEAAIVTAEGIAPNDRDVRELAAQVAWHRQDYAKALRLYQSMAADTRLTPQEQSAGWTGLGIVQMTTGVQHAARVSFLRALRLDRRNAAAWYHLGLLYREAPFGYNEAALEQFEVFVRLTTEASPRVQRTQRVVIPALKEMIARAAMDRRGAAARNSAASATALSQAQEAMKKKLYKTARQKYQEAYAADVLSYPAALGLADASLKLDATAEGQRKALSLYKQACALRPSAVSTFIRTGDLASRLGNHALAAEVYSRALAANPASVSALDGLIRALRTTGDKDQIAAARTYQLYREAIAGVRKR